MSDHFVGLLSLLLTIFATFVSISYFLRPFIVFKTYKRSINNRTKWVTEVRNRNWLPLTIKEIKCEMAISHDEIFTHAKTLKLIKSETLFLHKYENNNPSNYIFVPENEVHDFNGYVFLRTRFLVSNLLGIKKHYEKIYKIDDLEDANNVQW